MEWFALWYVIAVTNIWLIGAWATKKYDLYSKPWYIKGLPAMAIVVLSVFFVVIMFTTPL